MRDILFRGKRTDNEKWVYGFFNGQSILEYRNDRGIITKADKNTHAIMRPYPIDIETLGQYTGLTDKNGKKIFEGDILKDHSFTIDDFSKVVYDTENAQFSLADCDEICDTMEEWKRYREDYEIVGNVYDNPELVESED